MGKVFVQRTLWKNILQEKVVGSVYLYIYSIISTTYMIGWIFFKNIIQNVNNIP